MRRSLSSTAPARFSALSEERGGGSGPPLRRAHLRSDRHPARTLSQLVVLLLSVSCTAHQLVEPTKQPALEDWPPVAEIGEPGVLLMSPTLTWPTRESVPEGTNPGLRVSRAGSAAMCAAYAKLVRSAKLDTLNDAAAQAKPGALTLSVYVGKGPLYRVTVDPATGFASGWVLDWYEQDFGTYRLHPVTPVRRVDGYLTGQPEAVSAEVLGEELWLPLTAREVSSVSPFGWRDGVGAALVLEQSLDEGALTTCVTGSRARHDRRPDQRDWRALYEWAHRIERSFGIDGLRWTNGQCKELRSRILAADRQR